jgi:GGDEF domain-containing protein
MGGDEFVVLVDFKQPRAMEELVHRIEAAVENRNASKQRPYRLALSIGRAYYDPATGQGASEFLAYLDTDMYSRKRNKKSMIIQSTSVIAMGTHFE